MKCLNVCLALLFLAFPGASPLRAADPGRILLARGHFAGSRSLGSSTNAAQLKKMWALPESAQLSEQILQKLARAPEQLLAGRIQNTGDHSALIRPLLDDCFASESIWEWVEQGGHQSFTLAIQLEPDRASLWNTNLAELFRSWKLEPQQEKAGWSAGSFRFAKHPHWAVISIGALSIPASKFDQEIEKQGRPAPALGTNFLSATIDWPRLGTFLPLASAPLKLARTEIAATLQSNGIRTVVRAVYPEAIGWKYEPWAFPSNLIHDPLVSFTASQKLALLMKEPKIFQRAGLNPFSGQLFFWSRAEVPFESLAAMPLRDAGQVLQKLAVHLTNEFNPDLQRAKAGELSWQTNTSQLVWRGLPPVIVPFLGAYKGASGEVLMGGLFPLLPGTNPPPAELVAQFLPRRDLVYYDWEITQERLTQWRILDQVHAIVTLMGSSGMPPSGSFLDLPGQKWMLALAPLLGNSATEIIVVGPNEIRFSRKSHSGFSSVEILLLSKWLNHPAFPLLGFRLPPATQ